MKKEDRFIECRQRKKRRTPFVQTQELPKKIQRGVSCKTAVVGSYKDLEGGGLGEAIAW